MIKRADAIILLHDYCMSSAELIKLRPFDSRPHAQRSENLAPIKTWNFCKIKHLTFLILFSAEDKNVVYM